MKKYDLKGNVAVMYSPGYGAGWSTWNDDKYKDMFLYDSTLVDLVLNKEKDKIPTLFNELYPDEYFCLLGLGDLEVRWIPEGTFFRIDEYDGSESFEFCDKIDWSMT